MEGYRVIRSSRKTLALEITRDCEVIVRAPRRCSVREIEKLVDSHTDWIERHLESVRKRAEARPEPTPEEREAYIEQALTRLPERVWHYSEIMGLVPSGITITEARTRFGSCSPKNRLCFSWRLMMYPPEAVDYVVVHELAHLAHRNHGAGFYALVAEVLPDYKTRRELLKR